MKPFTVAQVAAAIDHAVLKPDFTAEDVQAHARMCIARGVKSMCVRPCDVALAVQCLAGSPVLVSAVVGFPHGHHRPEVKALEAELAIGDGARELDMVMSIGRFLAGDYESVRADIAAVVAAARPHGVLVKVIQESGYLSLDQVAHACRISEEAGADFVKTSTGFGPGCATPEIVEVMLRTVGGRLGVKPSGGIRDWATAVGYLAQGANRLGVGSTEAVLDGGRADDQY
ncbi:MAG: deoxyribose-phosphate aldolase [Thermoguttaceae bacterium]|jgi:deoxyribose-phosphate aldolase|nr:deoxyribose-phosphate aldolase [Thermoguttaceae bacterium]